MQKSYSQSEKANLNFEVTNTLLAVDFPSVSDCIDYQQMFSVINGIQDPIIAYT